MTSDSTPYSEKVVDAILQAAAADTQPKGEVAAAMAARYETQKSGGLFYGDAIRDTWQEQPRYIWQNNTVQPNPLHSGARVSCLANYRLPTQLTPDVAETAAKILVYAEHRLKVQWRDIKNGSAFDQDKTEKEKLAELARQQFVLNELFQLLELRRAEAINGELVEDTSKPGNVKHDPNHIKSATTERGFQSESNRVVLLRKELEALRRGNFTQGASLKELGSGRDIALESLAGLQTDPQQFGIKAAALLAHRDKRFRGTTASVKTIDGKSTCVLCVPVTDNDGKVVRDDAGAPQTVEVKLGMGKSRQHYEHGTILSFTFDLLGPVTHESARVVLQVADAIGCKTAAFTLGPKSSTNDRRVYEEVVRTSIRNRWYGKTKEFQGKRIICAEESPEDDLKNAMRAISHGGKPSMKNHKNKPASRTNPDAPPQPEPEEIAPQPAPDGGGGPRPGRGRAASV